MKLHAKMVSVLAIVALTASLATGCTAGQAAPTPTPPPRPDYIPEDVIQYTAGIAKDTPLLKVDGVDVSAEQVLYWVSYSAYQFSQQFAQYTGGVIDWTMEMSEGVTMKDYMLTNAIETAKLYQVVLTHANALGFGLTKENEESYQKDLAGMKESLATQMSGEDPELAYVSFLATVGLSDAGFAAINQTSLLFQNIREGMYGENGKEPPTAEAVAAWTAESGTLRASHILIKAAPNADGTDDGMAAALLKATALREELRAAGDTAEKFEELKTANSEDVGADGSQNCPPEGYVFGPGEMVATFEEGTKALEFNQVGEPVQSDYGYHIIMRLDESTQEIKDAYSAGKTTALADQWVAEAQVEKTAACDALDLEAFYNKLSELRTTVQEKMTPVPEATPAPEGSAAPVETPAPSESPAAG